MQQLRFAFSTEGCEAFREDVPQYSLPFSVEALVPALQSCIQEVVAETLRQEQQCVKILDKLSGETETVE